MKNELCAVHQTELTLTVEPRPRRVPLRPYQRRRQHALWWFREMHRVVDATRERGQEPGAPAAQPRLELVGEG